MNFFRKVHSLIRHVRFLIQYQGCTECERQIETWVLVSEPGFLLGFGLLPWKSNSFTRNEAQEQHSLLDTIFDYIFYFGPPGKYLYLSPQNLLHVGQQRVLLPLRPEVPAGAPQTADYSRCFIRHCLGCLEFPAWRV